MSYPEHYGNWCFGVRGHGVVLVMEIMGSAMVMDEDSNRGVAHGKS